MGKKLKKSNFFIVLSLLVLFACLTFFGLSRKFGDITHVYVKSASDIRWGIDIRGGVDVTFTPPKEIKATESQMAAAETVIKQRLVAQNITDSEVYTDNDKNRIIVRFPWKENEKDFNPERAVKELGETALLTFREGSERDDQGKPKGVTKKVVILEGKDVKSAEAALVQRDTGATESVVSLKLNKEGTKKFAEATKRLAGHGVISIWMDDDMISAANVNEAIEGGEASISGQFTPKTAKKLADQINSGSLPFKLQTENFNTISPILGLGARDAMLMAGVIAFICIAIFMISIYRLPGVIAVISLAGQVTGMIASITGFFGFVPSFTLTLPGIAGIILAIGMGVDANVITFERIKEEIRSGKTVKSSIDLGYERAFTAILDGNVTVIIVASILMGAFGPPTSFFAKMLKPLFILFGAAPAGAIYSFGYTLLVGVVLNFVFGVNASKIMLRSISNFKVLKNPKLYGGKKNES
ncbi:MAG: SecD/SecF family protein translocase subunit [Oscillospiraceae bacterium]|nr:SecD/SecF family protein translocase subunit [Oscillospiraceae bacterium]